MDAETRQLEAWPLPLVRFKLSYCELSKYGAAIKAVGVNLHYGERECDFTLNVVVAV